MTEEDKRKADTLLELYKIQLDKFNKRRNIEWKVALGLWSGIFVFTYYMHQEQQQIPVLFYWVILMVFIYWTWGTWTANEKDKRYGKQYMQEIEKLIPDYQTKKVDLFAPRFGFFDWARSFQIITTIILLSMSWYLLNDGCFGFLCNYCLSN